MVKIVSVADFRADLAAKPDLFMIDVRTEAEHAACHVPGVRLYPLQDLNPADIIAAADRVAADTPIYILCKAGGRAKQAAEKLSEKLSVSGSDHALIVVEGGTDACHALGMPTAQLP